MCDSGFGEFNLNFSLDDKDADEIPLSDLQDVPEEDSDSEIIDLTKPKALVDQETQPIPGDWLVEAEKATEVEEIDPATQRAEEGSEGSEGLESVKVTFQRPFSFNQPFSRPFSQPVSPLSLPLVLSPTQVEDPEVMEIPAFPEKKKQVSEEDGKEEKAKKEVSAIQSKRRKRRQVNSQLVSKGKKEKTKARGTRRTIFSFSEFSDHCQRSMELEQSTNQLEQLIFSQSQTF